MPALVWVVDDSPLDLQRAEKALAGDFEVRGFTDGSSVLEQLATQVPPDVLVVDWLMPHVTGVEVIRFMRSGAGRLPAVPVLLLTARNQPEQIVEGLDAGATDYVGKPYADEELRARVRALVRTSRLLERALRAESTIRTLLATAPDALVVVDAQGRITYVNAEAERAFCRPAAAIVGQAVEDVLPTLPVRSVSVAPDVALLPLPDVHLGERVYSPSVRVLPSDTAARTTIALRDVTERRRADARRTDFYSISAHDLRSPLNSMLLRLDLLLQGRRGPMPAEAIADVRKCEGNIRGMMRMINDFLDLARMEGAGFKIACAPVDLGALVSGVLEDVRPLADARGVRLRWAPPERPLVTAGDSYRLAQVVSNLLGNAIKYTAADRAVEVRIADCDGAYEVSVRDDGPGIPADLLPSVFDRFTRAPDAPHRAPGWGLGLMIVREIVEAHGGHVGVHSEVGRGSTFWFSVPRAIEGAPASVVETGRR